MTSEQKTSFIRTCVLVGFIFAFIWYYCVVQYGGVVTYPQSTFLFNPGDKFHDFRASYQAARSLKPYDSDTAVYPPFAYVSLFPFAILKDKLAHAFYLITVIVASLAYLYHQIPALDRMQRFQNALIFSFMSYPFLFLLDRGNIEWNVVALQTLFLHLYFKGNNPKWATRALTLAAAIKPYPLIFIALLVGDRKYREAVKVVAGAIFLNIASLFIFHGNAVETFHQFTSNLHRVHQEIVAYRLLMLHSSSLFSFLRLALSPIFEGFLTEIPAQMTWLHQLYLPIAVVLISLIGFTAAFVEKTPWKRIALLVLGELLLPEISFDYKLSYIYAPLIFFLQSSGDPHWKRNAVLFALILVPKGYWVITGEITSATLAGVFVLLVFLAVLLRDGLRGALKHP